MLYLCKKYIPICFYTDTVFAKKKVFILVLNEGIYK